MKSVRSLTHKLIFLMVLLSLFAPALKSFAQATAPAPSGKHLVQPPTNANIEKDKAAVRAMLKDPRLTPRFEKLRQKEWQQYSKDNGAWGGGHSVRRSPTDRPVLLDFFTALPDFVDPTFKNPALVETDSMQYLGYEEIRIQDLPAYADAKRITESWRVGNESLIEMILIGLDNLSVQYVWRGVPLADSGTYFLPQSLRSQYPQGELTPVVAYHMQLGLKISAPEWNQLGDLSQAGLLIHEALRRVQLTYGLQVSQQKLQHLTATIALKHPGSRIQLETTEFVDQGLLKEMKRLNGSKINPLEVQQVACSLENLSYVIDNGFDLWNEPKEYVESFCKSYKNRNADSAKICTQVRNPKADLAALATEAALALRLLVTADQNSSLEEQVVNGRVNTSVESASTRVDYSMFVNSLPKVLAKSISEASLMMKWNLWRHRNCQAGQTLDKNAIVKLVQFLAVSEHYKKTLMEAATDAYISLQDVSTKKSFPALVEMLIAKKRAEQAARNAYKDELWQNIIARHIGGAQLSPEFLKILQGFRAFELDLQSNLPVEKEKF